MICPWRAAWVIAPLTAAPLAITTRSPTRTSFATVKRTGVPSSAFCGISSAKLMIKGMPSVSVTATIELDAVAGAGAGVGVGALAAGTGVLVVADAGVTGTEGVATATVAVLAGVAGTALGLRIASIMFSCT